jgi:PKD domain
MTRSGRRRRLRRLGGGSSALVIVAGLALAATVGGGAPHASANLVGASPGVFVGATGNVDTLSLSSIQSGTTGSGSRANTEYGPIGVNATGTNALEGATAFATLSFVPPAVQVINVSSGARSPGSRLAADPIGVAMDPADANTAFVLEGNDGAASIERVNIGVSPPMVTPFVNAPMDVSGPTSIAISPDGATLYVGGSVGDGFFGVEGIQVGAPTETTTWSADRKNVPFIDGNVVDLAVSPEGGSLYAASLGFVGDSRQGLVFDLALPLTATEGVTWATPLAFDPESEQGVAIPAAVTVGRGGQTVYVGGTNGNSANSSVQVFAAASGSPGVSTQIPMATNDDGSFGLASIAITPDGQSLVTTGTDDSTEPATEVVYPLSLPNLTLGPRTILTNLSAFGGPQELAITPDQAPVARLAPPSPVQVGQTATFDASASTVAYGSVNHFAWTFGDGATAATAGPTASHAYAAPGSYLVTVTARDSAGTSVPPSVAGFAVDGAGQTAYRRADLSARTSVTIRVTAAPPASTTTTTTSTSTTSTTRPGHATTTTTTTVPGRRAPATPKLILNPGLGPPGTVVTVTGSGFRPNTPVTVAWSVSSGSVVITADAHGNLPPSSLVILTPDVLGPRFALASSTPQATAPFLVVPGSQEPGGDNASVLFRSEGP